MTTVRELIDSSEKWTRGTDARDKLGYSCMFEEAVAVCWCLRGGLQRCYRGAEFEAASLAMRAACERLYETRNYVLWQDSAKWPQVKRLLDEAGV